MSARKWPVGFRKCSKCGSLKLESDFHEGQYKCIQCKAPRNGGRVLELRRLREMGLSKCKLCGAVGKLGVDFFPSCPWQCRVCTTERTTAYSKANIEQTRKHARERRRRTWERDATVTKARDWAKWLAWQSQKHAWCKREQRHRECEWALSASLIRKMYADQQGKCAYTGLILDVDTTKDRRRTPNAVSVDRIDSSGGYTPDNVCLCCMWVNKAKAESNVEEFKKALREAAISILATGK